MDIVARTHPGRLRPRNEDWVAVDPALGLALLADGMGGLLDGHRASRLAVEAALAALRGALHAGVSASAAADHLVSAVASANARVRAAAAQQGGAMGTTLELAWIGADGECRLVHVGDSRAYHYHQGRLLQVTRDHSLVQDLVEQGQLTPAAARRAAQRNVITRAVGLEDGLEPAVAALTLAPGDLLLLCSDGLWDMLDDGAIAAHLARCGGGGDGLARCAEALVDAANEAGGHDNVSVVLVRRRAARG